MPKNVVQYDLLISCPGDITAELGIIDDVVAQFNDIHSEINGISVQTKHWIKSAYPESGGKPQALINKQFVTSCDAAVALFWSRFGTPTDSYGSGTEEEIEEMLASGKQVFVYFSNAPVAPSTVMAEQYQAIRELKERYKDRGVYFEYSTPEEFGKMFTAHLTKHFLGLVVKQEMQSAKLPDFQLKILSADSNEPIEGHYKYSYPIGTLYRRVLSEDDLTELSESDDKLLTEIAALVSVADIHQYNDDLPSEEEVDEFNKQQALYENAQNNAYLFFLELKNIGQAKGNTVFVDLVFPPEILIYRDYRVKDIKKPRNRPQMPQDPFEKARIEIDRRKYPGMYRSIDLMNRVAPAFSFGTELMGIDDMASILSMNSPVQHQDYSIHDHSRLTLKLPFLLHTRSYKSVVFGMILTKKGDFTVKCEIMCEEYEAPIAHEFSVSVE